MFKILDYKILQELENQLLQEKQIIISYNKRDKLVKIANLTPKKIMEVKRRGLNNDRI